MRNVPDIYFEEFWGQLNAARDGGTYHSYEYEDENGIVLYRFIKRPTNILSDTYDIVTPWGFSGPIILGCKEERRKNLVRDFNKEFQEYCAANHIAAEYIRFSPWLKNHEDFKNFYELKYNNYTLGIDLSSKDYFYEEFSSNCRNHIRKAEKMGARTEFDFQCETIEDFCRLYDMMADRHGIDKKTRLSRDYLLDTIKLCKDHVFIINGIVEGKIVSSGMFLHYDKYLHYHLMGNDPQYFGYNVNSLIISKACEWGKDNNKITLHLGGAHEDNLFTYKKHFTKDGIYDFYIGRKIRLNDLYEELIEQKGNRNDHYFPAYRAQGFYT